MTETYYVVADEQDPGSCHLSLEEARETCRQLQRDGYPDAIIIYPPEVPKPVEEREEVKTLSTADLLTRAVEKFPV